MWETTVQEMDLHRSGTYCFFSGIDNSPDILQDPTLKTYIIKDKSGDLTACGIQKQWVIEQGLSLAAPLIFMKVTTCLLLSSHFDTGNSSNNQLYTFGWVGRVPTPIDQSLY